MTKQEEIKDWLEHNLDISTARFVLQYLHDNNVVIKVEGELPEWALVGIGSETEKAIYRVAQQDMLKAGYTPTEPLIRKNEQDMTKEEKDTSVSDFIISTVANQEGIRDGLKKLRVDLRNGYLFDNDDYVIDAYLFYLHARDVRIRVGGGLPEECQCCFYTDWEW